MNFILIILLVLSSLALIALLVSVYLWRNGKIKGDEEMIFNAQRGVIIFGISLAILLLVFFSLLIWQRQASRPPIQPSDSTVQPPAASFPSSAPSTSAPDITPVTTQPSVHLGQGIIESHYPYRGQKNVPINTAIVIIFKEPMAEKDMPSQNVRIKKTADPAGKELKNILVTVSPDKKTFIFKLYKPDELYKPSTDYTVFLSPAIRRADGVLAFGKDGFYSWTFTTGQTLDTTLPKVVSTQPIEGETVPRNSLVDVTFSEEVLMGLVPVSSSVPSAGRSPSVQLSSDFKTLGVAPTEKCGENSCKQDIFCWPSAKSAQSAISLTLLASKITDMAFNPLDGNKNNKAEGSPTDDFVLSFKTSNEIRVGAPTILSTIPKKGAMGVSLTNPLEIVFDRLMAKSTLTTSNILITPRNFPAEGGRGASGGNWWLDAQDLQPTTHNPQPTTRVFIHHDSFTELTTYYPQVRDQVKDLWQNCFSPPVGP